MGHPVEVRGVCKRYGDRLVVDDVGLDVGEGEIVGLLGRTGRARRPPSSASTGCAAPTPVRSGCSGSTLRSTARGRGFVGSQLQESALPDRLRVQEAIELFRGACAMPVDGLLAASA